MKTIRFDGPEGHKLQIGEDIILTGQTAEVDDDVAEELVTAQYVDVSLVEDGESSQEDERIIVHRPEEEA